MLCRASASSGTEYLLRRPSFKTLAREYSLPAKRPSQRLLGPGLAVVQGDPPNARDLVHPAYQALAIGVGREPVQGLDPRAHRHLLALEPHRSAGALLDRAARCSRAW